MEEKKTHPTTVDEYILQYPEDVQQILRKIRAVIQSAAPQAREKISYDMPGYFLNEGLVWFGAWKNHIALYPRTAGMQALPELAAYKGTKGSVHFPLNKPIPYDLIRKIITIRVREDFQDHEQPGEDEVA
jgi:uncharacterized protein YdhG (YjbR/CyaY superfamily)